jgi:hypothetical protein
MSQNADEYVVQIRGQHTGYYVSEDEQGTRDPSQAMRLTKAGAEAVAKAMLKIWESNNTASQFKVQVILYPQALARGPLPKMW